MLAELVERIGHDVVSRNVNVATVAGHTRVEQPDVAIVGLGLSDEHALDMISNIVHEATCPVIAVIDTKNPTYVTEAAKRGVFAYLVLDDDTDELQGALDITLRRYAEFNNLQGAFGRRALIEQAKGILMERHNIDAQTAFERLRSHSQTTGRKLVDVAQAVAESHRLLREERETD